jgi:hypothetical protein
MPSRRVLPLLAAVLLLAFVSPAGAALPTGNLLANPGAETGPVAGFIDTPLNIPGWTTQSPARLRAVDEEPADSAQSFIHADERLDALGCRLFAGPVAPNESDDSAPNKSYYYAYQVVTITGEMPGQTLRFGGMLGRYSDINHQNTDWAQVTVTFFDVNGAIIGGSPAAGVDNYSATPAVGGEVVAKAGTVVVPAGATSASITVLVIADDFANRAGYTNGSADNVYATFDVAVPAGPPAGCQVPTVATTAAAAVTRTTATIGGTVDGHTEDNVRYTFHYGANGVLDHSTAELDLPAGSGAQAVGEALSNLEPATTYSFRVEARNYTYGAYQFGATQTFTTAGSAAVTPTPVKPGPSAPPPVDPYAGKLTAKVTAAKQRKGAVLVSGFDFNVRINHPGTITARVYVKSGRKKIPCGSTAKDSLLGSGSRNFTRGGSATSKCAAILRRKTKTAKIVVTYKVVDGRRAKVSGSKTFTIKR